MGKRGLGLVNLLGLVVIGVYYLVLFLLPTDFSNPTREFYVNDYADVFTSASMDHFLTKSEEVYERTKSKDLGGLQIVTATYTYEEGTSETRNKTDLFRKWKIGENDMGLLLLYSYTASASGQLRLTKSEAEVGYRLSGYLTAGSLGTIFDDSLGKVKDYTDLYSLQIAQAKAYGEILEHVLPDAYGINVIPFDEEAYKQYQIDYAGPAYPKSVPLNALDYSFSSHGNLFLALGWPLIFIGVFVFGGGVAFAIGHGGRSGGGGVTRLFH